MLRAKHSWMIISAALLLSVVGGSVPGAWAGVEFKTINRFTGPGGSESDADLVFDTEGNLYGTTVYGGASDAGTVFKLTPQSDGRWSETLLYSFCFAANCSDGRNPASGMIFDDAGNLYGVAFYGGANDAGAVFRLSPNSDGSWSERVLHSFNGADGAFPSGGLVFDQTGNLYGVTNSGGMYRGGVVFFLTPNPDETWTEKLLYSFCAAQKCRDGQFPAGSLIFDQAGNLYGVTSSGGIYRDGVVFSLTPNSDGAWTQKVVHQFGHLSQDGGTPYAGLVVDAAGNLFGTTYSGGAHSRGTVFELRPTQQGLWKNKILHSFTGADGSWPESRVIFDAKGNLYGTTTSGGDLNDCAADGGCGVVFKLTQRADGEWLGTVLHRFHDRPGAEPIAGVVLDAVGNLYGTTQGNGLSSEGSVYQIIF
jgi:uncharacterized repeat protein (TIGR03803 family)